MWLREIMLASELMTKPVITIPDDQTLADAARLLVEKRISGLPIVDHEEKVVGILTSTDFRPQEANVPHSNVRAVQLFHRWLGPGGIEEAYAQADTIPLRDVMNKEPVTAKENDPLEVVAGLMIQHAINHVPITRDGKVVGMITRHDFLRLAAGRSQ